MSKQIDALKLALETLEYWHVRDEFSTQTSKAITAIKEALAEQPAQGCDYCNNPQYARIKCKNCGREQPAQREPIAWMKDCADFWEHYTYRSEASQEIYKAEVQMWVEKLRTSPPASKPLTDAQIGAVAADIWGSVLIAPQSYQTFARAIEAAHGIKEKRND